MKTTIVTTTIYLPKFLTAYAENAERYNHEVDFIVIGDKKSPANTSAFCSNIKNCLYMDLEAQEVYLQRFHKLKHHLPINSIARRNVGHLLAYENGAESIIMLDDDNLSIESQDCIGKHSVVGKTLEIFMYGSTTGWFNICDALEEVHKVQFYPRGYPPAKRWKEQDEILHLVGSSAKVAVNAGLWVNDPDIDAITRLERRLLTSGIKAGWPEIFALVPQTWSPWNCQNSAISRAALPSYFLSPHTGRHLDIWASYITTRIAESQNEVITFGVPLAFHDRTPHNLYEDLEQEIPWIRMTDEFCSILRSLQIPSTGYLDGLNSVIDGLNRYWITNHPVKVQYIEGLKIWYNIFKEIA
jgi:hypothetical protein